MTRFRLEPALDPDNAPELEDDREPALPSDFHIDDAARELVAAFFRRNRETRL